MIAGRDPSTDQNDNLALACGGRAAQRIDIPKPGVSRKILDSHLPGHFGSGLATPHDAELRFGAKVENVDYISRLQLSIYALQSCAAAADAAQAGGLGEWAGMSVHAPDLDGKVNENARLAAPIHAMLLDLEWCSRVLIFWGDQGIVGGGHRQA
jgi:hypothetical protein